MTKAQHSLHDAMMEMGPFGDAAWLLDCQAAAAVQEEMNGVNGRMPVREDPDVSFDPAYMLAAVRHLRRELQRLSPGMVHLPRHHVMDVFHEIEGKFIMGQVEYAREFPAKRAQAAWVNFWKRAGSCEAEINDPDLTMRAWRAVVEALR